MDTKYLADLKVKEVMNEKLITVTPDTILKEVNVILERENIHHVPVIDANGLFEGIVSKSDILLLMDWGTRLELRESMRKNNFLLTSNLVSDIMTTNCVTVESDDSIEKCVRIFQKNFFHALPVLDHSSRKLVGIITTLDLINLAYNKQTLLA
jgi:CBS-domain-containing membrane protein